MNWLDISLFALIGIVVIAAIGALIKIIFFDK
jgi:preprotein translocase subunit Sss1